jgi:hypothetical protein
MRLYALRHTAATLALTVGVSPKVVSEQRGHTSAAFTLESVDEFIMCASFSVCAVCLSAKQGSQSLSYGSEGKRDHCSRIGPSAGARLPTGESLLPYKHIRSGRIARAMLAAITDNRDT